MIANHSQEIIEYAKEFNYQIVECLNYGDIHKDQNLDNV